MPPRNWAIWTLASARRASQPGTSAMMARNVAPASVMWTMTRCRKSAVCRPGRMPGMKEPDSFMFLDISAGLNINDVQKYEKK